MQLVKTSFDFPASENSWDAVRYWVGMSVRFKQADLACQIMAGFALQDLHKTEGIAPGRPKTLPQVGNSATIAELSHNGKCWEDTVQNEAGVSLRTAHNWMAMAGGIK